MISIKNFAWALAVGLAALLVNVSAQTTAQLSTVNVTSEGERVRVTAQGDVYELRVDVADEAGEVVFESSVVTGNTLDWKMTDAQGQRVMPGTYLVTVTFRTPTGKLRKRVEQVTVTQEVTTGENQKQVDAKSSSATTGAPNPEPNIAGTGTTNKIAKWTDNAGTLGNSIISETSGRIGINGVPTHTLTINGGPNWTTAKWIGSIALPNTGAIGWASVDAGSIRRGFGSSNGRLLFFRTESNLGGAGYPLVYDMTISNDGNVGIGTTGPQSKLTVWAPTENYGLVHTNGTVEVGTWAGSGSAGAQSGWFGTKSNHPLRFFAYQTGAAMTIMTNGNVGIGVPATTQKLQVNGNEIYSTGDFSGFKFRNRGSTSSTDDWVLYSQDKIARLYRQDLGDMLKVTSTGNVMQKRDSGGLVKALVYVSGAGNIVRCYNGDKGFSLTGGTTNTGCGFTVTSFTNGGYGVNFDFKVNDRFVSVSPEYCGYCDGPEFEKNRGANFAFTPSATTINVFTFETDEANATQSSGFMLIVF